MNIRFIPALLSAFVVSAASAALISPEKALERVSSSSHYKVYSRQSEKPQLIRTVETDDMPTIYIFGGSNSFIALSADDETAPLLGYSDRRYEADNLPPAFESWIASISDEIALIRENNNTPNRDTEYRKEFSAIAPLCATSWNQDSPYNDKCPKPKKSDQRCYTGCVATAMAQVMKYHEWPVTGEGSYSYLWDGTTLKANFENITYDWANMLDKYPAGEYTEEQGTAVATLMRSCGISVEMNYGTSASGALSGYVAAALGKYFRYDKSKLRYILRDYYSLKDWETTIYNSLKECGPVILDGQSTAGGHSFVCDGYDTDGLFHINWGWGGISDGYFLLSALDPFNQGIGGSGDNTGFDYMQDAVIGITPAKSADGELLPNGSDSWFGHMYGVGDMGIDTSEIYYCGESIESLCPDGVYNYGPAALRENTAIGLLFRSETGDEGYISYGIIGQTIGVLYGFAELTLPLPESLPDGTYTCTLAYADPDFTGAGGDRKGVSPSTPNEAPEQHDEEENIEIDDSAWIDVIFPAESIQCYKAAVKEGMVVFSPSYSLPSGVESIEFKNPQTDGKTEYFTLQGIKITEPRPGELVIVRKNGIVSKRIF